MAVISSGNAEELAGIEALHAYYGSSMPTVAELIGGRPKHAIITGDITFDDKVYSFRCLRQA